MAVTSMQELRFKPEHDGGRIVSAVLASGQTVYANTIGYIGFDGLLYNATSSIKGKMAVIVAESKSTTNGDSVCLVYTTGRFIFPATSLTQIMVGDVMYVVDNFTFDNVRNANSVGLGRLVKYTSATEGEIELGEGVDCDELTLKVAITAAVDGTGGGALNLLNPFGVTCMVKDFVLDLQTASTDALGALDIGIAATGTSNDSLIDGRVLTPAGYYSTNNSPGTNGGSDRKLGATQYITATSVTGAHLDIAGTVAFATITFKFI